MVVAPYTPPYSTFVVDGKLAFFPLLFSWDVRVSRYKWLEIEKFDLYVWGGEKSAREFSEGIDGVVVSYSALTMLFTWISISSITAC